MKSHFHANHNLGPDEIEVTVSAADQGPVVNQLLDYLDAFQTSQPTVLTVKTADEIRLIKIDDIIYVTILEDILSIVTKTTVIEVRERLAHFQARTNPQKFVQISRHALINLDHLTSLSNSFSGNMTAHLLGNHQVTVSRRYVKNLTQRFGL
ncbi:LytTR family DNA-binding domain-containing protein [Fructobacillus ficulneus]|uniref:LytTr DNA-binding domain protein n=1 Tax=Fructobacillus ficulneus TaxID=157463 RepID=A0A0K8MK07_9LACO|nr:LytTR family DNA-binding domain-containing protein [Fructobacillus ficulneus]GAP00494.1 LytTr DNA-binding domain protein [Fructobacillus ficulneus]